MKRAPVLVLVVATAVVSTGCKKPPPCNGKLSSEDLATLQAKAQKGEQTCEELAHVVMKVDEEGVTLNDERINIVFRGDRKDYIPHATEMLNHGRENWIKIHPSTPFKGAADLEVPVLVKAGAALSAIGALETTGFTHVNIHSGDTTLTTELWGGPVPDPRAIVHVEHPLLNMQQLQARFAGENGAPQKRLIANDASDLAAQLTKEWPADGKPRAMTIRVSQGTFHELLVITKQLLDAPPLAHAVVQFEVGLPVP